MDHAPTYHEACKSVLHTIHLTWPAGNQLDDALLAAVQSIAHVLCHPIHDRCRTQRLIQRPTKASNLSASHRGQQEIDRFHMQPGLQSQHLWYSSHGALYKGVFMTKGVFNSICLHEKIQRCMFEVLCRFTRPLGDGTIMWVNLWDPQQDEPVSGPSDSESEDGMWSPKVSVRRYVILRYVRFFPYIGSCQTMHRQLIESCNVRHGANWLDAGQPPLIRKICDLKTALGLSW